MASNSMATIIPMRLFTLGLRLMRSVMLESSRLPHVRESSSSVLCSRQETTSQPRARNCFSIFSNSVNSSYSVVTLKPLSLALKVSSKGVSLMANLFLSKSINYYSNNKIYLPFNFILSQLSIAVWIYHMKKTASAVGLMQLTSLMI